VNLLAVEVAHRKLEMRDLCFIEFVPAVWAGKKKKPAKSQVGHQIRN